MSRTRMCDPCKEKWDAWTDHRFPATGWKQFESGHARMSLEVKSAYLRERGELIDWQCRMIREVCLRDHDG